VERDRDLTLLRDSHAVRLAVLTARRSRLAQAVGGRGGDRSGFDSGAPALDEWLRRYAGQNRRRDTVATWVVATPEGQVVACASLAMTAIDRSAAPRRVGKQSPDRVPALLLGRLAVDKSFAGLGVGTALVAHVLATAVELNEKAACRAVVATALDARVRAWWERLGFHAFHPDDPTDTDL
jgi:GNAT superfamily N-acetyltransferase